MKIVSIVGARPQFIKLAPFYKALQEHNNSGKISVNARIDHIICHTGQHFDEEMSNLFFEQLNIPVPNYLLEIKGKTQVQQLADMMAGIESVILEEKPDLAIVFGDTNSTLAGSLASTKSGLKALHIEAGLRSFNRNMPEEINRIVSDHISDFLFAPTETALSNLSNEGLGSKSYLTGDIMVDSLKNSLESKADYQGLFNDLNLTSKNYYLLTLHRPYTVDDPSNLKLILEKLSTLSKQIIFPVHPRTRKIIESNSIKYGSNIKILKPVGYLDFIRLEQSAEKIITDSGGIQKEAYILKIPCITVRPETEWIETVKDGWNILTLPTDKNFTSNISSFNPVNEQSNIFGSDVANKMIEIISKILSK